jgi:predicted alpha-1,2-mannosidase
MKFGFIPRLTIVLSIHSINCLGQNSTQYVNPMIGTGGHGHTFPGPSNPFGMVQLSPDNKSFSSEWDWASGYHLSDTNIVGFSHTHFSGTGIGDLGDILLMPYVGYNPLKNEGNEEYKSGFSHKNEIAEVGKYTVFLNKPKVKVDLACSNKVGLHQYTFPASDSSKIVIDLMHKIFWGNTDEALLSFDSDTSITGFKVLGSGWQRHRRIYFYIKFSKAYTFAIAGEKVKQLEHHINTKHLKSASTKGYVNFKTKEGEKILVKVAISMVSIEHAKENMKEIPNWRFDELVSNTQKTWNNYLDRIVVDGLEKDKQIFYTSLYHTLIQPNQIADADGTYMGPDYNYHTSSSKKYYSTFSLWDTYRAAHPLYTLLVPEIASDLVHSMVQHFEYAGYLPMWTAWGSDNHCMIANHSIPVITDAILKGLYTQNLEKVLSAMVISSTNDHTQSPWQRTAYEKRGYFAYELEHESISKTLEASFNDWCVAQVAKKIGNKKIYEQFMNRSKFYQNLFHPTHLLMYPKDIDGNWKSDFSPTRLGTGHVTEGNSWQYTWSVQHDPQGLMALYKTRDNFIKYLDSTFNIHHTPPNLLPDVSGLIGQYAHGNEPSHHMVYWYNYAGQPWKTQQLTRKIMAEMYANTPEGICGNEDCGQMSAWYVWNALGLYPSNPASGIYDIGSPIFKSAVIKVSDNKTFKIVAPNVSDKNIYIKSIKLNGKKINRLYISHQEITQGGTLEFTMDSKPNKELASYAVFEQKK